MSDEALQTALRQARRAAARGKVSDAMAAAKVVLQAEPENAEIHLHLARALINASRPAEALAEANYHLDLMGPNTQALDLKLSALIDLKRDAPAIRVTDLYPEDIPKRVAKARVANNFGRPEEGLKQANKVLARRPDHRQARHFKARSLMIMDRYAEALEIYEGLLAETPKLTLFRYNHAVCLMNIGRTAEALPEFDTVAQTPSKPPYAIFNRGLCRLTMGDFPDGLEDYAMRWRLKDQFIRRYVSVNIPQWQGDDLIGRRIVAYGEQGLGDIIQFIRFAPLLVEAGAKVTLCIRQPLHSIVSRAFPDIPLVTEVRGNDRENYDYQVSLIDIPRWLKVPLSDVWQGPYLSADQDRKTAWRSRLRDWGRKIAICWSGKPSYRANHLRSPDLMHYAPLASVPGVRLISIQKGFGADQVAQLAGDFEVEELEGLDASGSAFEDTAAVIANCELVITCDTSIAHLAGAMGVRSWVALQAVSDWRWMTDRDDSPWYPSTKLFRQPRSGDWRSVFEVMAKELAG